MSRRGITTVNAAIIALLVVVLIVSCVGVVYISGLTGLSDDVGRLEGAISVLTGAIGDLTTAIGELGARVKDIEDRLSAVEKMLKPPPVEIHVMVGAEDVEWWKRIEGSFRAKYPEYKDAVIIYETPPDITTAFFTAMAAGRGPDIVAVDSFMIPSWAEAYYLEDITDLVEAWEGWAQYPEVLQEICKHKGRVYGLLKQTDVRILFYRKDKFVEAGILTSVDEEWQPTTWDGLLEDLRTLKAHGVTYPMGIQSGVNWGEGTTMQAFLPLFWGAGGTLYDWKTKKWIITSQAYLDALGFYRTLYSEGLAEPGVPTEPNPWDICLSDFQEGKTAVYLDGQWAWGAFRPGATYEVPNAEVNVGFAKIPGKTGGFFTASGGHAYAISVQVRNRDAAFKLLGEMLSKENMAQFCIEKEWVAPRLDVAEVPEYRELKWLTWCVEEVMPHTDYRPALPEYPKISERIQLLVERVATLEMTPEKALKEYAEYVTTYILAPDTYVLEIPIEELGP